MTKNHDRKWVFVLGGPETQLHDILWVVHEGQNRGRNEGEKFFEITTKPNNYVH